ncbi:MAG: PQQ-binding-like beta-propeller repeat protein [Phycisphaerales bacterium]|nr:PQQ-binding-like beta-propeller repeat protein [Phycisphaerales bacterium]
MRFPTRVVTTLGLLLAGASGAVAQQSLLSQSDLDKLGYFKFWSMQLEMGRARAVTGAYVLDDSLYITTDSGDVHALDANAGLLRWAQNAAENVYEIFPPTHFLAPDGRGLVVITTSPRTLIIDRYAGDIVADMPLEMATSCSAVAADDRIYFGSSDGHFYAMRWTDPRTNRAVQLWRVIAGGPVTSDPVLVNNNDDIIFASQGGSVYDCTAVGKILNWQARTGGPIIGNIAVDGPGVFAASADRSLYRYNLISGALEWRSRFPEPLNEGPTVSGGVAFQYCRGEGLTALDAQSGDVLWKRIEGRRFVCRGVDYAMILDNTNTLLRVDINTGEVKGHARLPKTAVPVTNVHDNTIYLAANSGSVFCAKPSGTPYLTPAQLSEARRVLRAQQGEAGGDRDTQPPPRRPEEPALVDPNDPLRSASDKGTGSGDSPR